MAVHYQRKLSDCDRPVTGFKYEFGSEKTETLDVSRMMNGAMAE